MDSTLADLPAESALWGMSQSALEIEAYAIQAQLEGLFRQLFQACTQLALARGFDRNDRMMEQANVLMDRLAAIVKIFDQNAQLQKKEGPLS